MGFNSAFKGLTTQQRCHMSYIYLNTVSELDRRRILWIWNRIFR